MEFCIYEFNWFNSIFCIVKKYISKYLLYYVKRNKLLKWYVIFWDYVIIILNLIFF